MTAPVSIPPDSSGDPALRARREAAALASAGRSDGAIYGALERLVVRLGLAGDVLDYGAGVGNLAGLLEAMGIFRSITAADIMGRPPELPDGIAWVACDLNSPTPLPGNSFDAVVSAEVIEHLENPRAVTREWFRLLKPGGGVLLSTPNNESLRSFVSLVVRGHFAGFTGGSYPAHITALLRKDLSRALTEAGFQSPEFFFTNDGGVPGRPVIRWQSLSASLFKGMRFSDNVIAFARKPL